MANLWEFLKGVAAQFIPGAPSGPVATPDPPGPGQPPPDPPKPPGVARSYRPCRVTKYYCADRADYGGPGTTPVLDSTGNTIGARVPANFFANLALEGTGLLADGLVVNVTDGALHQVPGTLAGMFDGLVAWYDDHRRRMAAVGRPPRPPGYFGFGLDSTGRTVISTVRFRSLDPREGYGNEHGIPKVPFRTIATDIGAFRDSEPTQKGGGGLIPVGTRVHVKELEGVTLPDGTTHDGWTTANDTGGAIFGAHVDLFVGPQRKNDGTFAGGRCSIWFEGIEGRWPVGYDYGLEDT